MPTGRSSRPVSPNALCILISVKSKTSNAITCTSNIPVLLRFLPVVFYSCKIYLLSETRQGIQPTVPINDATLNDSNVNKFVLPGSMQCYVLKTNVANVMGKQFARIEKKNYILTLSPPLFHQSLKSLLCIETTYKTPLYSHLQVRV